MIIFSNASADIKMKSADVLLNMIIILSELRILQMCSENEQTLEFKLEKIIGIQKHAGKVRKGCKLYFSVRSLESFLHH